MIYSKINKKLLFIKKKVPFFIKYILSFEIHLPFNNQIIKIFVSNKSEHDEKQWYNVT